MMYSSPFRIPHYDEEDIDDIKGDDAKLSDIPLSFDDLVVADPCASHLIHRRGSFASSTSIETYM